MKTQSVQWSQERLLPSNTEAVGKLLNFLKFSHRLWGAALEAGREMPAEFRQSHFLLLHCSFCPGAHCLKICIWSVKICTWNANICSWSVIHSFGKGSFPVPLFTGRLVGASCSAWTVLELQMQFIVLFGHFLTLLCSLEITFLFKIAPKWNTAVFYEFLLWVGKKNGMGWYIAWGSLLSTRRFINKRTVRGWSKSWGWNKAWGRFKNKFCNFFQTLGDLHLYSYSKGDCKPRWGSASFPGLQVAAKEEMPSSCVKPSDIAWTDH